MNANNIYRHYDAELLRHARKGDELHIAKWMLTLIILPFELYGCQKHHSRVNKAIKCLCGVYIVHPVQPQFLMNNFRNPYVVMITSTVKGSVDDDENLIIHCK